MPTPPEGLGVSVCHLSIPDGFTYLGLQGEIVHDFAFMEDVVMGEHPLVKLRDLLSVFRHTTK